MATTATARRRTVKDVPLEHTLKGGIHKQPNLIGVALGSAAMIRAGSAAVTNHRVTTVSTTLRP